MPSALEHAQVVPYHIRRERSLGRMLGPFLPLISPRRRFGVIPKGHNTGKWRLITDLSFPRGQSVNDGIDSSHTLYTYMTVDKVTAIVTSLSGALLAKVDIESAYCLLPVHPDDRLLQAVAWQGSVYVDPLLPFGMCSACTILNALADAIAWHLQRCGIPIVHHYLDDFIIVGPPVSYQCRASLATFLRECFLLGVPIASQKTAGPTTCLTFLVRTPLLVHYVDKLTRLVTLLVDWQGKLHAENSNLSAAFLTTHAK